MNDEREIATRERMTLLWTQAEPAVSAFVFSAVRSYQDAEDLVQQVALSVARRFHEYDASRPFVAWALWMTKSQVVDYYRKCARERKQFSEGVLDQIADVLVQQHSERSARQLALEECYEKLPQKSRRLLELRYVDREPIESIAKTVKSTGGSVRVMLSRVRRILADCIQSRIEPEAQG